MNEHPWKEYNQKVLKGELDGRTMPENSYGEDDFSFFENEVIKKKILKAVEYIKDWKTRRNGIKDGFVLFGSLANGAVSIKSVEQEDIIEKPSDIDLVMFWSGLPYFNAEVHSDHFGVQAQIVNLKHLDLDGHFEKMARYTHLDSSLGILLDPLAFVLIGFPIGKGAIHEQQKVISYLKEMSEEDRNNIWRILNQLILEKETGRNQVLRQKYGIIGEPLTFEQFLKRWEMRVAWGKKFCKENKIRW